MGRTRRRAERSESAAAGSSGSSRTGTDVGRGDAVRACADFARGANMGRCSAAASSRAGTRAIVGCVPARGAACADVGLARTGAERLRSSSGPVVGGSEARGSTTGRGTASSGVERGDSIRAARARRSGRAGPGMVGPSGTCRPVVGRAREHRQARRSLAFMGGARRGCTERTGVRISVVGRARGPVMGSAEEPRTSSAGSAVLVGSISCSAPSTGAGSVCTTTARACSGPIVVAAGRVTGPA